MQGGAWGSLGSPLDSQFFSSAVSCLGRIVSDRHRYPLVYYINLGSLCVRLSDTTILHFNSPAESASAFSMAEPMAVMTRQVTAFSMAEPVAVR